MTPEFLIRAAQSTDFPFVYQLIKEAFIDHPHSDHTEHLIVERLKQTGQLTSELVAASPAGLIGYIAFSPVKIDSQHGDWYGLGPVAVDPACQRTGVGQALIRQGLATLGAYHARGCVVAGDPAYYGRFGFRHQPTLLVDGIPSEYFMGLSFEDSVLPSGLVHYSPAFYI